MDKALIVVSDLQILTYSSLEEAAAFIQHDMTREQNNG